jgi:hypothetical protein
LKNENSKSAIFSIIFFADPDQKELTEHIRGRFAGVNDVTAGILYHALQGCRIVKPEPESGTDTG